MEQLSGLDASFLTLETDNAPMHIGGVSLLDPELPDGTRLDLDGLKRLMQSRLDYAPTFRRKLATVPLDLGKPYWVEEENVDLDLHIERTQLPEPGGFRELAALASWETAQPLPRDRPLWSFLLVEGLGEMPEIPGVPPNAIAIISKVHHAAVDGVSGAELMAALFDPERRLPPEASPAQVQKTGQGKEKKPKKLDLLRRSGRNLGKVTSALPSALREAVKSVSKSRAALSQGIEPPPLPFSAPRTPMNVPLTQERVWSGRVLDLNRVRAVKSQAGTTLNNVVLTICAGALRRYMLDHDALPEDPLVAMVPISVRAKDQQGAMGNQVSAMLVGLGTGIEDPVERLRAIHEEAQRSKLYHEAIGARTLTDSTQFLSFALSGVATRLYTRLHMSNLHRPIFNLVITNVPGPQVPLYVGGARLVSHIGLAPIFDGMGLILPIMSYAGTLAIGAVSDRAIFSDIHAFTAGFETELDALEAALA